MTRDRRSEIVAWVDRVGRLRCIECAQPEHMIEPPIYRNEDPHSFERCDSCGRVCNDADPLPRADGGG